MADSSAQHVLNYDEKLNLLFHDKCPDCGGSPTVRTWDRGADFVAIQCPGCGAWFKNILSAKPTRIERTKAETP